MNIGGLTLLPHRICRGCGTQWASAMTSQVVIGKKWLAIVTPDSSRRS